ncbi:general secretion pathway protein GspB [Vibrio cyclitrophicus]|uniref:general secretion pathway protein GspB n=1 Tax=Vibrio cyclitrophicus TaxID=47951 RepID=UPI000C853F7C|nr:general secretion pathway protein GspB [Vibrio cyclitrophicus]PME42164.1 general secretion pathway protein GspA [Vibrio cyclitrophicus]PMF32992.1 general secretion pathway protein GspA [Vibrio cyclitrophicus]
MSRIMHELKQSELRGYQSHHVPNSAMAISKKKGSSVAMGLLFMLVPSLIVGGTLAYQSYNDQQQSPSAKQPVDVVQLEQAPQPDVEVEIAEAGTQSVDTASEGVKNKALFAVRAAPVSQTLAALPRQAVYAQIDSDSGNRAGGSNVSAANADNHTQAIASSDSSTVQSSAQPTASDESRDLQSDSDLLQGLDFSELPPDLALKLESIMGEQQDAPEPMDSRPATQTESQTIELESHSNSLSGVLPKLDLQTHMYSSSETKRWVKVNGQEVAQGDWIGQDIQLLEIKPQSIVIEFNQQKIEIPALYEWKG